MHTKQCTQCSKTFKITDRDQGFYRTINVPEPTHCWECRLQRRLAWRNERTLYPRTCDMCRKKILTLYAPDSGYTVYCQQCYWGDGWDGKQYARDIDWSRSFIDQFVDLLKAVPHAAAYNENPENSEYVNYCYEIKNAYLCFGCNYIEDSFYLYHTHNTNNSIDCVQCTYLELCSHCVDCSHCYNTHYSQECQNMRDSYFCFDCKNSVNCFGSAGLRNKEFVFFNTQLTEVQYNVKVNEYLRRYSTDELYKQAENVRYTVPQQPARLTNCEAVTGNHVSNSINARYCFDSENLENCKYVMHVSPSGSDAMDVYGGSLDIEHCYEFVTGLGKNLHFSMLCWKAVYNIDYSIMTNYAHDCFGCASLNHAQFSIFNKQYIKSEYETLRQRLISTMIKTGEWGEFFPVRRSIFGYNETVANVDFPLTKLEAQHKEWKWQNAIPVTMGKETVDRATLPSLAKDNDNTIVREIFKCSVCARNFKIIEQELVLYKKLNIYLPNQCHECRFRELYSRRNKYQIWQRQCMCTQPDHGHKGRCSIEFETTYSPERKEIVYCEECYKKEMY